MNTTEVENFPGFIQGIQGPELMENIGQQAERFGTDIRYQDVEKVELTGDVKKVYTADGAVHLAKTVIMTTGSQVRKLNIEAKTDSPVTASPGAQPAMASSSRTRKSQWSAVATPRWRRHCS